MAAPTFGLFGTPTLTGTTGITGNYTSAGGKRILFMLVATGAGSGVAPSVFTFGGVTATLVSGTYVQHTAGAQIRIYEIDAASAPAAGSNAVVVVMASTTLTLIGGEVTGDATGYADVDSGTTTGTTANAVNGDSDVADCLGISFVTRGGTVTDFAWSSPSGVSELIGPVGASGALSGIAVATLASPASHSFSTTRTGGVSTNAQVVLVLRPVAGGTSHDGVGASSLSSAGIPTLGQNHQVSGVGASSLSNTATAAMQQNHQLVAAGSESDTQTGTGVYGHTLVAAPTESDTQAGVATLQQNHQLLGTGVESDTETSGPAVGQNHQLVATGAVSASQTSNAVRLNPDMGGGGGALGGSIMGIGARIRRMLIGG
jgi:hypothetical protein